MAQGKRDQLRVGLIFHSSKSGNLGVGALTSAGLSILRDVAAELATDLKVVSFEPDEPMTPYISGDDFEIVRQRTINLINPLDFYAQVKGLDMVIDIGAGDSFADIYGNSRFRRLMLMKGLVHAAGVPLILAPQTLGPFNRPWPRKAAAWTMNRSLLVVARDETSVSAATAMGVTRPILLASDVALRLPYERRARSTGGRPQVGLNVSGLLLAGGYSSNNQFGLRGNYPRMVRGLIASLQEQGADVWLVPHVINPDGPMAMEDDLTASHALAAELPGVQVAPRFASPSDAKSWISGLDFFAGARMHACIAAFSSGVPMVAHAYSRKFEGLFGSLGYRHVMDCQRSDERTIIDGTMAGFQRRDEIAAEGAAALARGLARLRCYQDALKEVALSVITNRKPDDRRLAELAASSRANPA
jgi:polysaccharide pyruvyl transferase WcaK-like protein